MDRDRIEIDAGDRAELRAALEDALRATRGDTPEAAALEDKELDFLLLRLDAEAEEDDILELPPEVTGRRVMGAVKLGRRYVLKVRTTLLVAAVATLDALKTAGCTVTTLAGLGVDLKALVRLSDEDGEVCLFAAIDHLRQRDALPAGPEDLRRQLLDTRCACPESPCTIHAADEDGIDAAILAALRAISKENLIERQGNRAMRITF